MLIILFQDLFYFILSVTLSGDRDLYDYIDYGALYSQYHVIDESTIPLGMSNILSSTAVAALSQTLGVQMSMRLSEVVFENTTAPTRVYLQLHACEQYKNNYNFADPHADNLELSYLPSTNR